MVQVFERVSKILERCNPSPHVALHSPRSYYDVILITTSRAYGARSPRSHYDVILIVKSFATELATPSVPDVCYVRTYVRTDTLPRLMYKDGQSNAASLDFVSENRIVC